MELLSSSTAIKTHPRSLHRECCMTCTFEGGYQATLWNDGTLFTVGKNGRALAARSIQIIAAMKAAINQRFPKNPLQGVAP